MQTYFKDVDFSNFWDDSQYALEEYVDAAPSDAQIATIETELGYKLPAAYIQLMKMHNGGIPHNLCFPTKEASSWAEDHIAVTGLFNIGHNKDCSLGGDCGSQFWIEEWGYPDIGVYFADCPSAGHDMILLDYRKCGKQGEPEVAHVDQESDYKITFLAKDFETFIQGLVHEDVYDTSLLDFQDDLEMIESGQFSALLQSLCKAHTQHSDIEQIIRKISRAVLEEKNYFALHADPLSYLLYDVQFMLYSQIHALVSMKEYLEIYPNIMAMKGDFNTGGYAPDFVKNWSKEKTKLAQVAQSKQGLKFTDAYMNTLNDALKKYQ
ncbi:MAG: SMI1/KNR4 family protein [Methylophilaceae bacterium]